MFGVLFSPTLDETHFQGFSGSLNEMEMFDDNDLALVLNVPQKAREESA